jgi:PTH1 family peptidyl-tRNA hydrolase
VGAAPGLLARLSRVGSSGEGFTVKIVCGLGNPGREYEGHRHNVGFRVVEALARRLSASFASARFDAEVAQAQARGEKVLLLKPQTFMNRSGQSLGAAARFYKVPAAEVLVVHDELDLPFGRLQLKAGGGTGGHNGLHSILESWGEQDFARLRVGIGKPEGEGAKERVIGHVLGDFSQDEGVALPALVDRAAELAERFVVEGLARAMNAGNRRAPH